MAGSPCTPMLAMWPPGRTSRAASSKVAGTPTASIATSAPSPPVSSRMTSSGSSRLLFTVTSAPNCLRRLEPGVGQVDRDDVARAEQAGADDRGQADRAGADDRDHVARPDAAVEHADLVAGRQDVGQHQDVLVGRRRPGAGRSRCRRTGPGRTRPGCRRSCGRGSSRRRRGTARRGPRGRTGSVPHAVMHDTRTRSPALTVFTPPPTDSTVPTASWPRMRPSVTAGTSPLRMCRSVPQIVVASTRTIASVSAITSGFGTSSQAFTPGPWYTSARMSISASLGVDPDAGRRGRAAAGPKAAPRRTSCGTAWPLAHGHLIAAQPPVSQARHRALARTIWCGVRQETRMRSGLATMMARALAREVATFSRCGS